MSTIYLDRDTSYFIGYYDCASYQLLFDKDLNLWRGMNLLPVNKFITGIVGNRIDIDEGMKVLTEEEYIEELTMWELKK